MNRLNTLISRGGVLCCLAAVAALLTYFVLPVYAEGVEQCLFTTQDGVLRTVIGRDNVPARYRRDARCMQSRGSQLAAPDEVTLQGNIRRETITTTLGTAELRWPRSVEGIFGRTPLRATVDAARTVSKTIRSASFSSEMQNVDLPWKIIFMDEELSEDEIPAHLISNCHPGWMTPPANIYIVAQRVAAGCGSERSVATSVADSQLAEVLVHEMAHAIEYQLLAKNYRFNRMRSEGFATWFEQYSAQYSSFINQRKLQRRNAQAAAYAINQSPELFAFSGSAMDYARAAMYFMAIEDRFGLSGVTRVYERMVKDSLDFYEAIQREFTWNRQRLASEVERVVERQK